MNQALYHYESVFGLLIGSMMGPTKLFAFGGIWLPGRNANASIAGSQFISNFTSSWVDANVNLGSDFIRNSVSCVGYT